MAIKVSGTTVIDDSRNLQNSVNLNVSGNVYANTFIGDGSQLTNLPPSGGTITATASGALSDGSTVILNSNGTVSVVADDQTAEAVGSGTVFESATTTYTDVAYDTNAQKIVIVYRDDGNSSYGTAVVGTVSGSSISFGTPVVYASSVSSNPAIAYDTNAQKVVVAYQNASNFGAAIVGTVSGTSISFGSSALFVSATTQAPAIAYDTNAQKVVIAFRDQGDNNYGTAIVGTVSGTSISFGTANEFEFAATNEIGIAYHAAAQKVVIAYQDQGNSNYGTAKVGTVSGTSISFGSATVFESADSRNISVAYDTGAERVVVVYYDFANGNYGTSVVGTVTGTGISFGPATVFEAGNTRNPIATYDANAQKVVITYEDLGNSPGVGTVVSGTVSGSTITYNTPSVFANVSTQWTAQTYDPDTQKIVISYQDGSNSNYGTAVVYQTPFVLTNLTATNYLGISDGAYANNTTATVQVAGSVDDAQSGLTPGQQYFVQANGSIDTTADSPSVVAGTAVAATKLLIKG